VCYSPWYNAPNALPADNTMVHYTTSCNAQSSAPEDGRDQRPKHVELIGIINKPLFLHLVGIYIIYIYDARSNKYPFMCVLSGVFLCVRVCARNDHLCLNCAFTHPIFSWKQIGTKNYRVSSLKRNPLIRATNPFNGCTLTFFYRTGCLFIAGLFAVERTTLLLRSDRGRRPSCIAQSRSLVKTIFIRWK